VAYVWYGVWCVVSVACVHCMCTIACVQFVACVWHVWHIWEIVLRGDVWRLMKDMYADVGSPCPCMSLCGRGLIQRGSIHALYNVGIIMGGTL